MHPIAYTTYTFSHSRHYPGADVKLLRAIIWLRDTKGSDHRDVVVPGSKSLHRGGWDAVHDFMKEEPQSFDVPGRETLLCYLHTCFFEH